MHRLPTLCIALGLVVAARGTHGQASDSAAPPHFEFVQVVPDVYVAYQPSIDGLLHGNQTFVVNDSDVFVFDANFTPAAARATIDLLRRVTPKPIRTLAYSHWHNDHVWGTQAVLAAYPGPITLLATDSTRDDILHEDQEKHAEVAAFYPAMLASVDSQLASGVNADPKQPLTPRGRASAVALAASLRAYMIPQSHSIEYHLPTTTFARRMTLYDGSRTIELLNFGRGNTRGDAVVFLPKERVVMTGDLLVYPVPFAFDAHLSEWIRALHAIKALGATHIIPGHGPPETDYRYLDLVTRLLTSIRDQTKRAVTAKLTLAQATRRIDLTALRTAFTHGDRDIEEFFDGYVPAAIQSGYDEATRGHTH